MNTNKEDNTESKKIKSDYIVGIGASAGGLEAIQKLLKALPSNTGFPFIIVQHLSPDYKSLLGEILGKYTDMPVIQVEDGMEVKPDCVYVIQPGKNMRISKGKLLLSAQREKELNLPIDMFFRSLAEEAEAKAIAIVLSGTGSDGTNGIKDIKEKDGMIIVQDAETSKFDGMPRSAMRTGLVDAQLTPEEIALELQHISTTTGKKKADDLKKEKQIDEELMKKVYIILKKISGVNFTHYKQTTILRRIERRMMLVHKENLSEYVDYLYELPEEVKTLSKEVLIGVTNFFRDKEYFQCLKDTAIQDIIIHSTGEEPIRAWVAGCSTGEEAYSIAILFCEIMETLKIKRTVKIFATDLDVEAITTAGKGVYSDSIMDSVSPARLSRYFTHRNNSYTIKRDIRKMIVFSPHNVFQDPPFGRLDLISCRNMLIYFQPVLQNDLFAIFHASLKDEGYLFLGKSEAIGAFTEAFPVVDAAAKIFTHRSDIKILGQKTVPYLQSTYLNDEFAGEVDSGFNRKNTAGAMSVEEDAIDNLLLEKFMPACLIVNEKNELVHTYGDTSNFIHMPVGKFTNNLFDLVTEALKIPASTLLKEAREKKEKVQYKDIRFVGETKGMVISLTAMPISKSLKDANHLYALVFSKMNSEEQLDVAVTYDIDRVASQRITDLEQDLNEVQGKLNRSIAEQECVNEELQAANEELLTANEELQSSNEELQSVNEELYTVNSEYQQKLTELADLNDDIANFLSSTLTGIIFVDNKLNIRRYTDYVTTEFSVMDHDIGRSLKFISYHFPTVDITEICDNVLKTLVPDEREITTSKNKIFFMRVAPYRSIENKILGCVITLVDVTTQKQGQVQLQDIEKRLTLVQQANEEKGDFLSRITHEIRTPMETLVGLFELIKQQKDREASFDETLKEMSQTIDYMSSIVTEISEASKTKRISQDEITEPFALREVIKTVEVYMESKIQDAGLELEINMSDKFDPIYEKNKTAVRQILTNFLNHAIKYTSNGGKITLKIFEDNKIDCKKDEASLCIIIADNGMGMSKNAMADVFKPFAKSKFTEDEDIFNMGLGLSIAHNLIKSMNGTVITESEEGKGTTFTIHLHMKKGSKRSKEAILDDRDEEFSLEGCNVLVAEDNVLNRKILCAILASENIKYMEACDGKEAVNLYMKYPENTFDCILMDMRMPKLDGIKATAMIRDSGRKDANTVGIVGVSANGFASDIKKARQAGVDEYTMKPIDRDNLFTAMKLSMKK